MATFNGADFVTTQIYSILSQSFKDWNLIIHDDASDDGTTDILKYFCKLDNRIKLIADGKSFRNVGVHFMYLLQYSKAPFVCFCDQDDIWLENKLELMYTSISFKEQLKEQVVFSDAYLYSSNNIWGRLLASRPRCLKELLFINGGIHGSACIFNARMRETLVSVRFDNVQMHDHLLTLIGCSFGDVDYINDKLFLYRQHTKNVTGKTESSIVRRIINAFDYRKLKYVLDARVIDAVKEFKDKLTERISIDDVRVIDAYLRISQMSSPIQRFFWIVKEGYSLENSRIHLWIKVLTRNFIKP